MRKPWKSKVRAASAAKETEASTPPSSGNNSDSDQDITNVVDPSMSIGTMRMDMHGLTLSDSERDRSREGSRDGEPENEPADDLSDMTPSEKPSISKTRRKWRPRNRRHSYSFQTANPDVLGIVFVEILEASDLPPERNMIRTGFDMDPFVIISFAQKTFRTRVVRHNLNPKWNEKLFFQALQREENYYINFTVYDWDKMSSNDQVGSASLPLSEIIKCAIQPHSETGVFPEQNHDMKEYNLLLNMVNAEKWADKHTPKLRVKVKFVPYLALRHQFWRVLLRNYDTDESETLSLIELMTMLDSIGSTLSETTIKSFFTRYGYSVEEENSSVITYDQAIVCLEDLIGKKSLTSATSSIPTTATSSKESSEPSTPLTESIKSSKSNGDDESPDNLEEEDSSDDGVERVISVKECPLCHQPRLKRNTEVDIVTHLAICASQDWRAINRIVMGNFVSPAQASRKWFSKIISKVYTGSYRIGADSANILVQDRLTGEILEEKMSTYVRVGIRLLYKGVKSSRMEGNRIRKLLASLSVKQGRKYDSPASAREIASFIRFHRLNMNEVLEPTENFKNFNEFFYRKLKPGARPCDSPNDSKVVVSPADCRMMAFQTLTMATTLWIKGREFCIERLLGSQFKDVAKSFDNGSIGIFRLAPQDYHRFHMPIDGVIGKPVHIEGQYYTVNPMAIRSAIDVFSENVRTIVPVQSDEFGMVIIVCVGAMMVGSTIITATEGQKLKRTDELGYFKFGGSTVLVLFQPGVFTFDEDLQENAKTCLETLVRVGMHVGQGITKAK